MEKGRCVYICHTTKKIDGKKQLVSCHMKYHTEKFAETTGTTRSIVDSDLTDQS